MSITSNDNDMPECYRYFPTGRECIHVYFLLIVSSLIILVSVVALLVGALRDDPDVQCTFVTMLTTTIAFWLVPPRLGIGAGQEAQYTAADSNV